MSMMAGLEGTAEAEVIRGPGTATADESAEQKEMD